MIMVERTKDGIRVAPWLVGIIVTLTLALMSFTIGVSVKAGATEATVEFNADEIQENKSDIKTLEETKADRNMTERTYDAVIRLEKKVDEYIENK